LEQVLLPKERRGDPLFLPGGVDVDAVGHGDILEGTFEVRGQFFGVTAADPLSLPAQPPPDRLPVNADHPREPPLLDAQHLDPARDEVGIESNRVGPTHAANISYRGGYVNRPSPFRIVSPNVP